MAGEVVIDVGGTRQRVLEFSIEEAHVEILERR